MDKGGDTRRASIEPARTHKPRQNLQAEPVMSCDCCPRAGKLETVPALPSTTRRHPQLIPVTSGGLAGGVFFPGQRQRRPGFLRDGETGAYSSPDPSPEEGRPKVSATGAHDSSSCVLKCSLDKSRPASPATYAFGFTRACEPGGGVDQRT